MTRINWQHIEFPENDANPRITWILSEFVAWLRNWDVEIIDTCTYEASNFKRRPSTYAANKDAVRDLAIKWQNYMTDRADEGECFSYSEFADWVSLFETLGRRFGLLTEFRENAIC